VKAALTGHLVLSTLHTNDAPGAIARMVDMGIEPFLVSSSVLMVCAQRLLRKICPHCKEAFKVPVDVITRLSLNQEEAAANTYYRGRGCSRCKDTGFLGRMAILEVLGVTNALRELILHDTSAKALKDLALKEGLKTLRMSGLEKAKAGLTSLDEVLRVSGSEH
jgi:type IV pilus assembly protein PilB